MSTINSDQLFAELDAIMAESQLRVVVNGGFTINDVAARYGIGRSSAMRRIGELIRDGKARLVGVRPGHGKEKVYELVNEHK